MFIVLNANRITEIHITQYVLMSLWTCDFMHEEFPSQMSANPLRHIL